MAGRGEGPDFVEALARGLDVLACFDAAHRSMSLSEVATARRAGPADRPPAAAHAARSSASSARPTAASSSPRRCSRWAWPTSRALGLWDIARPHLEALVGRTGESSSMAQLDGSDIVYVARVSVPKIIALRVDIGTRFPAPQTSQGKVLLAALDPDALDGDARRAEPVRPAAVHRPDARTSCATS